VVYGVTTGFGRFKDRVIPPDQARQLQRNLILSHSVGVGQPLDEGTVRAVMLIRANTLAKGFSGIRPELLDALVAMINRGVHPVIPCKGSVGASGDLAPLAHMVLVLIGEGEAYYRGERMAGAEALQKAGLHPIKLEAKEGVALINGTSVMAAVGSLAIHQAGLLAQVADVAGALSLEALGGTRDAFDERIHAPRLHPHQIECAAHLRQLLRGSGWVHSRDPKRVQDAYSLRCMPQVHGAVREAVAHARQVMERELNAAVDNPLLFWEGDDPLALSGGNFHGEPIALTMDYLAAAVTELGNISERRTARLVDPALSNGLEQGSGPPSQRGHHTHLSQYRGPREHGDHCGPPGAGDRRKREYHPGHRTDGRRPGRGSPPGRQRRTSGSGDGAGLPDHQGGRALRSAGPDHVSLHWADPATYLGGGAPGGSGGRARSWARMRGGGK